LEISELIVRFRSEKRLTLKQFADLVGVSEGLVSKWENKSRTPKADNLYKINQLLNPKSPLPEIPPDDNGKVIPFYDTEVFATISPAISTFM
jgi:transcriptional regulator with XRE-family HTH domain